MTPGDPPESDSPPSVVRDPGTIEAIRRRRLRILVADDHDVFRRSLALRLRSAYGATVIEVAGGHDVLRVARADGPFQLFLIDIRMPDLDGIDTAEAVREAGFEAPVVLMSAYYTDQQMAIRASGLVVLTKPIVTEALEDVLRMSCGDFPS